MSDLLYEVNNHVGVITLNRPDAMNSLTYQLYAELEDTVRSSEARVLVITGNGRAFCAGDDMKQILGSGKQAPAEYRDRARCPGSDGRWHRSPLAAGDERLRKRAHRLRQAPKPLWSDPATPRGLVRVPLSQSASQSRPCMSTCH